jgi:hypothetical protein
MEDIARAGNRPAEDVLKDAIERYQQGKRLEALATKAEAQRSRRSKALRRGSRNCRRSPRTPQPQPVSVKRHLHG